MRTAIKSFLGELKRRRVIGTAAIYCVAGWAVLEVSSVVVPTLILPDWTMRFLLYLVVLGFPVALVAAWVFDITPRGLRRTEDAAKDRVETAAPKYVPPDIEDAIASVAVIPFATIGDDAKQQLLSEGLATEIHMELSHLHRVRVVSRRASFKYRDQSASLAEIASALNVRYVLSGSLMAADDHVHIIAELDDASGGTRIWAKRYERDLDDVLSVLLEISESVVSEFGVERLKVEMERARTGKAENLAAWSLVQSARAHLLESHEKANRTACELLERAIAMDGNYAAAHATLAVALSERLLNGFVSEASDEVESIRLAMEKGLELAPHNAFVLKMSGLAWSAIGEPTRAISSLRSAVELAPYDFGAWGYFGWPLTSRGNSSDIEELRSILGRAMSIVPDHPGVAFWLHHLSVAHICFGDPEKSLEFAGRATDRHPSMSWGWLNYANALGYLERSDEARHAVNRALEANPHMTVRHYARQIELMSEGSGFYEQRTHGLREVGLLDN